MNTLRLLLILCVILGVIIAVQIQRAGVPPRTDVSAKHNNDNAKNKVFFPSADAGHLQNYAYPFAKQVNVFENTLLLESTDNPDTITNWYTKKMNESGMNMKAFIKTKTNENIKNILVGTKESETIRVEIERKSEQAIISIKITTLSS